MSSHTTSLVAVDVNDAQRAADAMLNAIPGLIAEAREDTIQRVLREERKWWFWSLSRAEAEAMVDREGCDHWGLPHRYTWWRSTGSGHERLARFLNNAATLSQDGLLWLNLDDADTVAGWLKP